MKKALKLRCSGFSIIALLVAVLSATGSVGVNENNIQEYLAGDSVSVSDFIEENFTTFVSKYNDSAEEEWQASYVENRFMITIDECGVEYQGVFLDFDLDNGYAVVGNEYEFLDFATDGFSPYESIESTSYYFSTVGGYYYLQNDKYVSIKEDNNAAENFIYDNIATKHYDGQEANQKGCGKIIDTDKYVKSKYGSGWKLDRNKSLPMKGYAQWDLSCYRKHIIEKDALSSYTSSEGSCWVISAYNVLQYMADNHWKDMPHQTDMVTYTSSKDEPNIYSKYFDSKGNNKSKLLYYNNKKSSVHEYFLVGNTRRFPKLYTTVRKHVDSKYKQVNDGGSIYNTSEIIEYTAKYYNHKVNAKKHVSWGLYADKGTKKLDNNYPLLWSTSSGTYGSHTMAVCGYKYYSKTSGWWIFKVTSYKLFYELRDGHSTDPRFYDISGHVGFSAIISLD